MSNIKSKTVASFKLSEHTEMRLCINKYEDGTKKPDLRTWYNTAKDPEWKPTPKGITFSVELLPELRKGLRRLEAKMARTEPEPVAKKSPKVGSIVIGYWQEKKGDGLPLPKHSDAPWKGKKAFLQALDRLEASTTCIYVKGFSTCRCCQQKNGNGEYGNKKYRWPNGLRHYVTTHNVKPPQEFIDYVTSKK